MKNKFGKLLPEIKIKWLELLRSGKYEQGQKALKKDDKYCCLGVLCEIKGSPFTPTNGDTQMPRRSVYSWSGLTHWGAEELAIQNDSGASFKDIAKIIEREL